MSELSTDLPKGSWLKPTGNKVLVRVSPETEKFNDSVLYKPQDVQQRLMMSSTIGWVAEMGDLAFASYKDRKDCPIQPGDAVVYMRFSGILVEIGDEKYRMMPDGDITGRYLKERSKDIKTISGQISRKIAEEIKSNTLNGQSAVIGAKQ